MSGGIFWEAALAQAKVQVPKIETLSKSKLRKINRRPYMQFVGNVNVLVKHDSGRRMHRAVRKHKPATEVMGIAREHNAVRDILGKVVRVSAAAFDARPKLRGAQVGRRGRAIDGRRKGDVVGESHRSGVCGGGRHGDGVLGNRR